MEQFDIPPQGRQMHPDTRQVLHSRPQVSMNLSSEAGDQKHVADREAAGPRPTGALSHEPVYFVRAKDARSGITYTVHSPPGPVRGRVDTTDLYLEVEKLGPVKVESLAIVYNVQPASEEFKSEARKVQERLRRGVASDDVVIWDEDLKRFGVDPDSSAVGTAST